MTAFGGGPLAGDNLVYFVYLDESGLSDIKTDPFLVVAGVIVNCDRQGVLVKRHLDGLIKKHVPKELQRGFVLNAKHIFNGKSSIRENWAKEAVYLFIDDVVKMIVEFGLPVISSYGNKEELRKVEGVNFPITRGIKLEAYEHAATYLAVFVKAEKWMRKHAMDNEYCLNGIRGS